jgi:hypothetical protein
MQGSRIHHRPSIDLLGGYKYLCLPYIPLTQIHQILPNVLCCILHDQKLVLDLDPPYQSNHKTQVIWK